MTRSLISHLIFSFLSTLGISAASNRKSQSKNHLVSRKNFLVLSLRIIFIDKLFLFAYFSCSFFLDWSFCCYLCCWRTTTRLNVFRNIRTIVYLSLDNISCFSVTSQKTNRLTMKRWHNGNQIKSSADDESRFSSETSEVVSQLFLNVTREYYGSKFECRAQNSKVLSPVVKEILVQIHCKFSLTTQSSKRKYCCSKNTTTGFLLLFLMFPSMMLMRRNGNGNECLKRQIDNVISIPLENEDAHLCYKKRFSSCKQKAHTIQGVWKKYIRLHIHSTNNNLTHI